MDDVRLKIEERLRAAFAEVMQRAGVLIDESLDEHFADMKAIFLRDRILAVSLGLGVEMNEAGQIEVNLTTGYVKEKVKQKTSARVTPGQMDLPGTAPREAQPMSAEQERRPIFDESRMLGAGAAQLAAGEPLHMGAGEGVSDRTCDTCRHRNPDGSYLCSVDPEAELCLAPERMLWDPGQTCEPAHPFAAPSGFCTDAESRLARVKEMDVDQLRQVIALAGCQKSVVKAAERRLKKLEAGDELTSDGSMKKQLATVAGMRTEQLVRMLEMAADAEQESRKLWPVEVVEAARKRLSVLRGEVMTTEAERKSR